jgi:endo-beta-N-acetylglucosaminidase D
MPKGNVFLIALFAGAAISAGGCMVAAVGVGAAGTVAYLKGDLEAVEAANLQTVYKATLKALDELELCVTRQSKDVLSAEIIARDAADQKVTINLKATTENTTKLSIRIGFFGSETKSRFIYQKIHDNVRQ